MVIILVEKITDEAKGVAAAIAEAAGGALMAAVQSVFSSTTDMSAQLVDYVTSMGGSNDPAMYPVVGLQAAAEHALRLAYEDWVRD